MAVVHDQGRPPHQPGQCQVVPPPPTGTEPGSPPRLVVLLPLVVLQAALACEESAAVLAMQLTSEAQRNVPKSRRNGDHWGMVMVIMEACPNTGRVMMVLTF